MVSASEGEVREVKGSGRRCGVRAWFRHVRESALSVEGEGEEPLILLPQHALLDKTPILYQHIRLYKYVLRDKHRKNEDISCFRSIRYLAKWC